MDMVFVIAAAVLAALAGAGIVAFVMRKPVDTAAQERAERAAEAQEKALASLMDAQSQLSGRLAAMSDAQAKREAELSRTLNERLDLSLIHIYLQPLFADEAGPDTLVLGCTHFPVLADAISKELPQGVAVVDSATTTAQAVARALGGIAASKDQKGAVRFLATDGAERFARVGRIFFGSEIDERAVEIIDL